MNLENKLIKEGIVVKNLNDETLLYTEEFKALFQQEVDNLGSILNYIPTYKVKAKSVTISQIIGFVLATDENTGKISNNSDDIEIKAITAEMKEINLTVALGRTALDLQGEELKKYICKKLADVYVGAIYLRLANELKDLDRYYEGTATQKWVTEFMKANLKGNALIFISDDIPLKTGDSNVSNGKYTIFGKECIFVPSELFKGILIIDKKSVEFFQTETKESYVDEISGNRKNVT